MGNNIDRRDFLKTIGCAGALIATSQLPAIAEDKPEEFPARGQHEWLSLSYATVHIGLEKPFSVLHVSDTHLTAAYPGENEKKQTLKDIRTRTFGGRQEEALKDTLAWARKNVDYVIHTGDLIDWQSEANFDLVRKHFGEDMLGSVGNHEYSTDMWLSTPRVSNTEGYKDYTRKKVQSIFPFNTSLHSQVVNGVNFVTLDNVYGYVVPAQVKAFKKEVKKGLPIVLCMHVPFHTPETWRVSQRFWYAVDEKFRDGTVPEPTGDYKVQLEDKTTSGFISYLKKEPLLKAILCGHEHITFQDQFSPTAIQYMVAANFLFTGREILFY